MPIFSSFSGQYFHSLASMIEGFISKYYDSSIPPSWGTLFIRKTFDVLLYKTLSEKLISPYRIIISHPFLAAVITLAVYLVFCIIYIPLWLISFVVTIYGSLIILFGLLHYLTIFIARNLAFPGSNASFQREVSTDYIRRLSHQLENISSYTANFTATIMLVVNNQITRADLSQVHRKLQEIIAAAENLPPLMISLHKAAKDVLATKCQPKEIEDINQFLRVVEAFQKALTEFTPEVSQLLAPNERKPSVKRQHFIVLAGRCLQASDNLRTLSASLRPSRPDDDMINQIRRMLLEGGPQGMEKLSFPTMRDTLVHKHNGIVLPITGSDGNKINSMIFSSKHGRSSALNSSVVSLDGLENGLLYTHNQSVTSQSYTPSRIGTVLFCGPNAAVYEVLSLANIDACWFGWYLSLGLDICFFNYRGYPGSDGIPAPDKVKADAMAVYQYLKSELKVEKIMVHGESIGGMAGCYLAKHASIDLLVADRTFASLDAVAMRMLNKPIGLCLKYLGFWFTDSVADYLDATCMKVVIQDVDDIIIHNTTSMKAGVAQRLLLNDASYVPITWRHSYLLADALGQSLPNRGREEDMLRCVEGGGSVTNTSSALLEDFIQHFYACVMHISRCVAYEAERQRQEAEAALQRQHASADSNAWEVLPQTNNTARRRPDHVISSESSSSRSKDIEENISNQDHDHIDNSISEGDDEDEVHVNSSSALHLISFDAAKDDVFDSHADQLKHYSNMNIKAEAGMNEYQKAWMAVTMVASVDGQLLGQAFGRGYDSVRTWIASLLIWSSRSISDPMIASLGKNAKLLQSIISLRHVIESLEKKRLFHHISSTDTSSSSSGIVRMKSSSPNISIGIDDDIIDNDDGLINPDAEKMIRGFQSDTIDTHEDAPRLRHRRKRKHVDSKIVTPPDLNSIVDSVQFICSSFQAFVKRINMMRHHDQATSSSSIYPYSAMNSPSIPLGFNPGMHPTASTSSTASSKEKDNDSDASLIDVDVDDLDSRSSQSVGSTDEKISNASTTSSSSLVKIHAPSTTSKAMHSVGWKVGDDSPSSHTIAASAMMAADLGIGCLLPTHVGHNGWMGEEELKRLKQYIRAAGFDIRDNN